MRREFKSAFCASGFARRNTATARPAFPSHASRADGIIMAGPTGDSTAKGKGKGRAQDDSAGSVSRPSADTTPRPDREQSSLGTNSGVGGAMAAKAVQVARLCCSEPVEVPPRKTLCLFAVGVAVLAVLRSFLLPVSSRSPVGLDKKPNEPCGHQHKAHSNTSSSTHQYRRTIPSVGIAPLYLRGFALRIWLGYAQQACRGVIGLYHVVECTVEQRATCVAMINRLQYEIPGRRVRSRTYRRTCLVELTADQRCQETALHVPKF